MEIIEETIDDLLHQVYVEILKNGQKNTASKGEMLEIIGASLKLTNPLARISRSDKRSRLFSALGEFMWYISGSDEIDQISYYINAYKAYKENGNKYYGAYGPRLINKKDKINQIQGVIDLLQVKSSSRRAVIQIFDAEDLVEDHKEIPCTCTLQFLIRNEELNLIVYMRSNDAYMGLPHDVFCFTLLQEYVASCLNVKLGTYHHMVGSLHIYSGDKNSDIPSIQSYLEEGHQTKQISMQKMESLDVKSQMSNLVHNERVIRNGELEKIIYGENTYWNDLTLILLFFRAKKSKSLEEMKNIKDQITDKNFHLFFNRVIDKF